MVFGQVGSIPTTSTNIRSIAQSGSASGLGPEGRRFESYYSDHYNAELAQLVEHRLDKAWVVGSSPILCTSFISVVLMAAQRSPKPLVRVRILPEVPNAGMM